MRKFGFGAAAALVIAIWFHGAHAQPGRVPSDPPAQQDEIMREIHQEENFVVAVYPNHGLAWAYIAGAEGWVAQKLKGDRFEKPFFVKRMAVVRSDEAVYVFNGTTHEWKPLEIGHAAITASNTHGGMLLLQTENSVHVFVPHENRWISATAEDNTFKAEDADTAVDR